MMPTARRPSTLGEVQPASDARLVPATMELKPMTDPSTDGRSIFGRVMRLTFFRPMKAKRSPTSKMIANMKKTARHERAPRTMPVTVGPIAGANMMTSALMPIASPSFFGGKISIATVNISGRISPVPIP